MPARLQTAGFPEHNSTVGESWSELRLPYRELFHPPLFRRLSHSVVPNASPIPPPDSNSDRLNPINIDELIERFKEAIKDGVVDLKKVTKDVSQNCLGDKTSVDYEKKGRREIDKIVHQVSQSTLSSTFYIDSCYSSLMRFFRLFFLSDVYLLPYTSFHVCWPAQIHCIYFQDRLSPTPLLF